MGWQMFVQKHHVLVLEYKSKATSTSTSPQHLSTSTKSMSTRTMPLSTSTNPRLMGTSTLMSTRKCTRVRVRVRVRVRTRVLQVCHGLGSEILDILKGLNALWENLISVQDQIVLKFLKSNQRPPVGYRGGSLMGVQRAKPPEARRTWTYSKN